MGPVNTRQHQAFAYTEQQDIDLTMIIVNLFKQENPRFNL